MSKFYWTTNSKKAIREQTSLKNLLSLNTALPPSLEFNSGLAVGAAYEVHTKRSFAVALRFDKKGRYDRKEKLTVANLEVDFPYKPGLYAFRVGPAICEVLDSIVDDVDLLLLDGQGIAHPRGFGLASHIGVLYNKPAVGVTRNNLYGSYVRPPAGKFNHTELLHLKTGTCIGSVLSLGTKCRPIYVSPGHRMSVQDSLSIVCRIAGHTCFPQPLNRAHAIANATARRFWIQHKSTLKGTYYER